MQHERTIPIPATTKVIVDSTTCDICGSTLNEHRMFGGDIEDITISSRTGWSYGSDGYDIEIREFDCCLACFDKHILHVFHKFNATPRIRRIEN